jgi:hypothetical protein
MIPEVSSSRFSFSSNMSLSKPPNAYIGCRQSLRVAVNDKLGIEPG